MVMGDDSCSKGRGFESRRRILDGHFFTFICCKNCNVCLKKTENKNKKEAGVGPIFKKKISCQFFDSSVSFRDSHLIVFTLL